MSGAEVEEVRSSFIAGLAAAGDRVDLGTLTLTGRLGAMSGQELEAFDADSTGWNDTRS